MCLACELAVVSLQHCFPNTSGEETDREQQMHNEMRIKQSAGRRQMLKRLGKDGGQMLQQDADNFGDFRVLQRMKFDELRFLRGR